MTLANFRINDEEWKEFKRTVPNASERLRKYVQKTVGPTDGIKERIEQIDQEIKEIENKKDKLEQEREELSRKLEKRRKINSKRKETETDFEIVYKNDKWRSGYDRIMAVKVSEPEECENCGEQITHGDLIYFKKEGKKIRCYNSHGEPEDKDYAPAVLLTDMGVNND